MGSSGRNQGCGLAAADEVYLTLHCRQLCGSERLPMVRLDRLGRPNRTVASTRLWPALTSLVGGCMACQVDRQVCGNEIEFA